MSYQSILPAPAIRRSRSEPSTSAIPFFTALRTRFRKFADLARSVRELEALTDRELADIGLARGQIRRAVRNGRG